MPPRFALTPRDVMLAHWLALAPEHVQTLGRYGVAPAAELQLDYRLGTYGLGRN